MRRTRRVGSGTDPYHFPETELPNLQKIGQFPDETVKKKVSQIHYVTFQTYCTRNNSDKGDDICFYDITVNNRKFHTEKGVSGV